MGFKNMKRDDHGHVISNDEVDGQECKHASGQADKVEDQKYNKEMKEAQERNALMSDAFDDDYEEEFDSYNNKKDTKLLEGDKFSIDGRDFEITRIDRNGQHIVAKDDTGTEFDWTRDALLNDKSFNLNDDEGLDLEKAINIADDDVLDEDEYKVGDKIKVQGKEYTITKIDKNGYFEAKGKNGTFGSGNLKDKTGFGGNPISIEKINEDDDDLYVPTDEEVQQIKDEHAPDEEEMNAINKQLEERNAREKQVQHFVNKAKELKKQGKMSDIWNMLRGLDDDTANRVLEELMGK